MNIFLIIIGIFSFIDCHENLYSKYNNEIMSKIINAEESYVNCNAANCTCLLDVMKEDLWEFRDGITKEMLDKAISYGVHYQIINNQLYRSSDCMFPARCSGVEYFINKLIDDLPNMEFVINVRDWPQISKSYKAKLPVFSFSKTIEYYDIMYPAWSFWSGGPALKIYPTGIGKWDLFRNSLFKEAELWRWSEKIPKGFFRGSRTSEERDPLILLSRLQPDLIDAAYTKNQAWKSNKDTLGEKPSDEVSFEYQCRYKYLFNFRGVAASFRLKFLFLCNSTVLHVGNEWNEFFYNTLQPWYHYIPLESNISIEKIENILHFLQEHDDVAMKIAYRGFQHIWNILTIENIDCYWKNILSNYSKLLRFKPKRNINLIFIPKKM